ncbi:MAG: DUF3014 domain-containing protein [Acidobacteria bacterium]|jgi:hypothetical protein|nr:DUF3014 domain-containing protein [Acidobacteriota bacterium]
MSDLEEYELEHTGSPDEPPPPYRPGPEKKEGGLFFPAMLALVAIVAIGLLAALYLLFRTPPEPEVAATPPPVAVTPPPTPAPGTTPLVLPSLDESDGLVRDLLTAVSTNPELARWLAQSGLIRTTTVVTVNVATGESPRPHLLFLEPKAHFVPRRVGRSFVPDPAGFAGYDVMANAIASLDAGATVQTYRSLEPLFEIAFQDFGMPDVRFRTILNRAIDNLLAVPVLDAEVELVPHATTFRYADPRYEQLSPAQKQFLRMGPRNVKAVQARLREIKAALAAPAERPAP